MEQNVKTLYENYSRKSDYTKLIKFINNEDGGEVASMEVSVFRRWVNISISKNPVKKGVTIPKEDKFRSINIPLVTAVNLYTFLYENVDKLDKEDTNFLYTLTKNEKVNDKNETVKLGVMYLGRDDKYVHCGLVLPQFKNVKFTFSNSMPGSKGSYIVSKNKDKVDEILLSKVDAKVYFKNVLKFLQGCMKEIDVLYNKVYPIKLKPRQAKEEVNVEVSTDNGVLDSEFEVGMDTL